MLLHAIGELPEDMVTEEDIEEIKATYIDGLKFHFVDNVEEIFEIALLDEIVESPIDLTIKETPTSSN